MITLEVVIALDLPVTKASVTGNVKGNAPAQLPMIASRVPLTRTGTPMVNAYVTSTGWETTAHNIITLENVTLNAVRDVLVRQLQNVSIVWSMPCGLVMVAPVSCTGRDLTARSKNIAVSVTQNALDV